MRPVINHNVHNYQLLKHGVIFKGEKNTLWQNII